MLRGRSSHWRCSIKKVFIKISQNLQKNTGARASFLIKLPALARILIEKKTMAQVFSCEFCKTFKSDFSTKYIRATASGKGRDIC